MGDTHFSSYNQLPHLIFHILCEKKWTLQVKYWPFDPKNLPKIGFLGSNALFSMSCTYYSSFEQVFLLNFDYFQPSGTILDLYQTNVEHNFALMWTMWSVLLSSHDKLGTNFDCFLTFLDGMSAHHQLFDPNLTIFGVKCPFFHG